MFINPYLKKEIKSNSRGKATHSRPEINIVRSSRRERGYWRNDGSVGFLRRSDNSDRLFGERNGSDGFWDIQYPSTPGVPYDRQQIVAK